LADPDDNNSEEETKRKPGRPTNFSLVKGTLEDLLLVTSRVDIKIDHLYEKFSEMRGGQQDHEVRLRNIEHQLAEKASSAEFEGRIRSLEQATTTITASRGTASWLWQAMWPMAGVIIASLGYLSNH